MDIESIIFYFSSLFNSSEEYRIGKIEDIVIREILPEENIPYDLLLLADETEEAINKYIFDSEIYLAEKDNSIVGVYAFYKLTDTEVEVKNIAIKPHARNNGIGSMLLDDASKRAKARNFKYIVIGTGEGSRQLKLYERLGFKRSEIRKNFFTINYPYPIVEDGIILKDMIVLRKELK